MEEYLVWKSPESHHVPKSPAWYLWNAVIAIIVAIIAVSQGNIMFLVFIIIAEIAIFTFAARAPRELLHALSDQGVAIAPHDVEPEKIEEEGEFFPYSEMEGFAIHHNPLSPHYSEIVFRKSKKLTTYLKVLIPDSQGSAARDILIHFLPEIEYEESLADHLLKRIGL